MRLSVSRRTALAVRVLRHLATVSERQSTVGVPDRVGTSVAYLPKVIGPLVRCGWVDSLPGPHGGYRLAADAGDISLLEVIETVEGPVDVGRCPWDELDAGGEPCPFANRWEQAQKTVRRVFSELAVFDGLDPPATPIPGRRYEARKEAVR